ncbi:MAG: ADP-glyceromanno-heptose 6-epimerase [Planctomycetota bacterium]|jgi:ADP-L-glycero-D-manno-heptose 6-epimerase
MIIVTGGAGFIGSAIVAELNARGIDDIVIVDILGSDERWKNLVRLRFADYVEADDFLEMLASGKIDWPVKAVFHMGACSDTTERNASYMIQNNYDFTKLLANWAAERGVRFIYASSAATYGDGSQGFCDDQAELNRLRPLNVYGYSKQMFDLWARRAGLLKQIVGLKYFNVFGPNEYHKADMRSFVLKAFEQINAAGKVRLFKSHRPDYADGEQKRDFLYIKDAVNMTLFFMDNPNIAGLFNLGTGQTRTWNDLAEATFAAMNKEPNIEYIPMPDKLRDKYQYFTQADITRIRTAGYDKDLTSLAEAIKDYVQNYLQKDEYLSGQ